MERIKEVVEEYLYHILFIMLVIIGLLIGGLIITNNHPRNVSGSLPSSSVTKSDLMKTKPSVKSSSSTPAAKETEQLYVDVKGAVKRPGVYQVTKNMRTQDAVNLAGGFTKSADKKQINLAGKLADQQVIYVPLKGEIQGNALKQGITPQEPQNASESTNVSSETSSDSSSFSVTNSSSGKINLNTADKNKLQELTGIGEKKAEQIIAYRESTGQFKQIEDLKNVSGFGDKTFENLKDSICV
ncbi:comEA protein [Lentilactobacillus senioris DSM 24302 = JCM 17472]|uniref:ComEA protein n=1 Tax=Lentilactobacillus senioris DSM 24302 = JCM 17472 TaxID=1423802 RepID=A0A0R2CS01_9LACO|nr:helix-hairpin-helix domain-containing protein [Lentilactobacillus senioris]KRM94042.1 comEA protein [Lentilactobacillus senioris DSM 24302 = JCM 17472]